MTIEARPTASLDAASGATLDTVALYQEGLQVDSHLVGHSLPHSGE